MTYPGQTGSLFLAAAFLAAAGLVALPTPVQAEPDSMARYETRIDVGVRYPGDRALKQGTVRTEGPEKGAYIEKCFWSLNPNAGKGFGLTQNCKRYTLKNTH